MKHTIRTALLLVFCLAITAPLFAGIIEDSLYSQVGRAVEHKISQRQKENEALRQQGLPGNYVVYVTDKDVEQETTFPPNVLSLLQQHTNQADVEKIWNFNANATLKALPAKLQQFSTEQGYDYYLVICAIYNYFRLDENTDFSNITWKNSDFLSTNAKTTTADVNKDEAKADGGYKNLLNYLVKKFKKDNTLAKSPNRSVIYHFVMTTYFPFSNGTDEKPVGHLRYFQGLSYTQPSSDPAFNDIWKQFFSSYLAEKSGTINTEHRNATKEEWLSSFVNTNQTMLAAIRNTHPEELAAITDKATLVKRLQVLPEEVYAGFTATQRIHMLRVLAKDNMDNDCEKLACTMVEKTPANQADELIQAMREANPEIPEKVTNSGDPLNGIGVSYTDNIQLGWCLLRCLTEFTNDKTLGIGGDDNYHRLIKGITALCYRSDVFKQKAKELNDSYLNADDDKIPDRVIFYTYNSFWSKVSSTFVNSKWIIEPKIDFSTSYIGCGLQMEKEIFWSYIIPNTGLQKLKLDPFEPIVFENKSDLGLLTDMDEVPADGQNVPQPTDHVVPAIILKYADEKASNETVTDVTMAAIDVASLATGYGELKMGITGARKAWVMFDMFNSSVNMLVNLAAYDNPKLKEILGYYNIATGAIALGRMGTGAVKSVKGMYNAIKTERTIMSAVNIRKFVQSVKNAGDDLADLHPDDVVPVKTYLQRLKDEAKARGLSNFEKSVDEALAVVKDADWKTVLFENADLASYRKSLQADASMRKLGQFLSIEEEAVVKYYTTAAGYKDFNKALRGELEMTEFFVKYEKILNKALDKLPVYAQQSVLWRGVKGMKLDDIKQLYKVGAEVTEKHFVSCAHNVDDFIKSARARDFEVLFMIKGKNGRLIQAASTLPEEAEVLFKSKSKFRVEKAGMELHPDPKFEDINGYPLIWTIVLEEL